jgi:3-hydroxyisobutyrate dehydrogenase
MRVGFVGLGNQGAPIARRIVDAGFPTTVWARRPEALDPFRDSAALIVDRLVDTAKDVDLLALCVFHVAGIAEVLYGPDGLAHALPRGAIIAVHSTISPRDVIGLARRAAADGLRLLDAPVSGGAARAAAGELVTMVGGELDDLTAARPVFATFAARVLHLGPVGAGQRAKLLNNALLTANLGAAADAFDAAAELGLDREAFAAVLQNGSGTSQGVGMLADAGAAGVAGLAASQARPTLTKDVELLAEELSGRAEGTLLRAARDMIARMRDITAA